MCRPLAQPLVLVPWRRFWRFSQRPSFGVWTQDLETVLARSNPPPANYLTSIISSMGDVNVKSKDQAPMAVAAVPLCKGSDTLALAWHSKYYHHRHRPQHNI
jgi:hypothetical protein